jgi:hypothetical protein
LKSHVQITAAAALDIARGYMKIEVNTVFTLSFFRKNINDPMKIPIALPPPTRAALQISDLSREDVNDGSENTS